MNISADYSDIIERLSVEFLEDASYAIEEIYQHLDKAEKDEDAFEESLMIIRRDVHNIKGQAGSFGFPVVTQVLHALEDYMELVSGLTPKHLEDVKSFINVCSSVLEQRVNPDEKEAADLFLSLPHVGETTFGADQHVRNISVLLVMPRGTQRTIVGRELASCGFRVTTAANAFEAIQQAANRPPDLSIITRELAHISGPELANVFKTITKTARSHQIILTSSSMTKSALENLPDDSVVIRKGDAFFGELTNSLINWGYFGNIN